MERSSIQDSPNGADDPWVSPTAVGGPGGGQRRRKKELVDASWLDRLNGSPGAQSSPGRGAGGGGGGPGGGGRPGSAGPHLGRRVADSEGESAPARLDVCHGRCQWSMRLWTWSSQLMKFFLVWGHSDLPCLPSICTTANRRVCTTFSPQLRPIPQSPCFSQCLIPNLCQFLSPA